LGETVYLDADGSIVPTTGELKQGMDISYKGIWGYAPLLITLANTREVLYLVNRPGNAPSHLDAATWIDKAIALVAPHAKRVCVRGDTDFALTAHFDRWARQVVSQSRLTPSPITRYQDAVPAPAASTRQAPSGVCRAASTRPACATFVVITG
jgi:hypothetical protein